MTGVDSIRVLHPLFQTEEGGATPTSALQLKFGNINVKLACRLNELWHSRLPKIDWSNVVRNAHYACYAAEYDGTCYAVAIWSSPVARLLAESGEVLELRRLAISPDAPKNTASRMLAYMRRDIMRRFPDIKKLVSYQDTEVHTGTIYKAAGWFAASKSSVSGSGWNNRRRSKMQTTADKVRWEVDA